MVVPKPAYEWRRSVDDRSKPDPTPDLDVDQLLKEWRMLLDANSDRHSDASQPATDTNSDPDPPEGWPLRLFHVPSMTSYPWKKENPYNAGGGLPKYAALSYTWGKYTRERCKCPEYCIRGDGDCIQINGIEWGIPSICPKHFTVHEFAKVVRSFEQSSVDYLWLDIACIDQRDGSVQKDLEIGRQYSIFSNTTFVFFWITTAEGIRRDTTLDIQPQDTFLTILFQDPWFKSLWTLQETYICISTNKPTYIINRQAKVCMSNFERLFDPYPINLFLDPEFSLDEDSQYKQLFDMLNTTGIRAMGSKDPVRVFEMVKNRSASRPEDAVYAIQQIFQFQLGNTAPHAKKKSFTLEELHIQFGMEFAEKYPLGSQIRTFNSMVDGGHTWCISPASNTPLKPLYERSMNPNWNKWKRLADLTPVTNGGIGAMKFRGELLPAPDLFRRLHLEETQDETRILIPYVAWDQRNHVEAVHEMLDNDVKGTPGLDPRWGRAEDIVARLLSHMPVVQGQVRRAPAYSPGLGAALPQNSTKVDNKYPKVVVLAIAKDKMEECFWGIILVEAAHGIWLRCGVVRWDERSLRLIGSKRTTGYFC